MAIRTYILMISILSCPNVRSQFHLYYMDRTTNSGLYYDCLYYKAVDHTKKYSSIDNDFKSVYEIIPYCIRPFSESEEEYNRIIEGNVSSRFTLEELRKENVTTHDLLSWSASIELVELYDEYLHSSSNVSLKLKKFYNCSSPWFGTFCQYTFNLHESFNDIVNKTFHYKRILEMQNMTCYIHLECDRGPAPVCLDWREICDGKVDCLGNDIDEINCFELEINECEENEFRCHNGICIPEEYLDEGTHYPDCLDGTDEDNRMITHTLIDIPLLYCFKEPEFWCEETDYAKRSRVFVCGDGQRSDELLLYMPISFVRNLCRNRRDAIIKNSILSYAEHSDLSYDCWLFLRCTAGYYYIDSDYPDALLDCNRLCDETEEQDCYIDMKSKCHTNFVIFPRRPVLQGHVRLVYLTNKTIFFVSEETFIFADYVCYDARKCPFLPSNSSLNINGTTCRSTKEFGLTVNTDIIHFFQACLIVTGNELEINYKQSSLFQCPGTTKYISKHRVLDGNYDCYNDADEINIDTCQWNDKHRFKCSNENKCISHSLVRNGVEDCLEGDDELSSVSKQIVFQRLCNGYEHLAPQLMKNFNETDETHCNDWPCNNLYTRCDGAWNCPNGADELNCIPSTCSPNTHECVSPETREVICLPFNLAGNGNVDCLGATDERAHCRFQEPKNFRNRYKCWNENFCIRNTDICSQDLCSYEDFKVCSEDVKRILESLFKDEKLQFPLYEHFMLERTATIISSLMIPENSLVVVAKPKPFNIDRTETCNRGVLVYAGIQLRMHCLCPPSYFGDRCQFQSQRVSLTLQFSRICAPDCYGVFGIIVTLIDQDHIIHSYEQWTYSCTHKCEKKFFIYLLYQSRSKNMTKTYHVRIDAYNKLEMIYHASWILPVKFLFLPVNRISTHLTIPSHPIPFVSNCPIFCGHGQCLTYVNTPNEYFCRCNSGWSGVNCTISYNCDCSSDSECLGYANNQSICLCTLRKYGPRCRLQSICQNETCKNDGQCVPDDERVSRNTFICLCPDGFFGTTCELSQSRINISFNEIEVPRSLLVHFITIQIKSNPTRTTITTKIPYDRDLAIVRISIPFHIIIVQISHEYFLSYVQANYTSLSLTNIQVKPTQQCPYIRQLFDNETIAKYFLLRRVKYYHLLCKNQSQWKCFHDNESFMCLCNEEQYANCFPFDFKEKYTCEGHEDCQHGAQCFKNRPNCPHSIFCQCTDCFYGSKCQFTTKGIGISLDAILGYQIRPRLPINRQPIIVKISIALTTIILIIGLINNILSIMIFQKKNLDESGCNQYLLATSIVSLGTTLLFTIQFWMLMLSQMSVITNITILRISCILIDFSLRLGPAISDWLNAKLAIDAALIVILDIKFNHKKNKQIARWVIIAIVLIVIVSLLHDPVHRELIYDEGEERRWCLTQYSSSLEIYNSVINIIHVFVPFLINILTAIIIIVVTARRGVMTPHQTTYRQQLNIQFHRHKQLVISPIILVLVAAPGLIISFISGCMKSARDPSIYLAGYFISFIPVSLTFVVFIIPSNSYMKEFYSSIERLRINVRKKLHFIRSKV